MSKTLVFATPEDAQLAAKVLTGVVGARPKVQVGGGRHVPDAQVPDDGYLAIGNTVPLDADAEKLALVALDLPAEKTIAGFDCTTAVAGVPQYVQADGTLPAPPSRTKTTTLQKDLATVDNVQPEAVVAADAADVGAGKP